MQRSFDFSKNGAKKNFRCSKRGRTEAEDHAHNAPPLDSAIATECFGVYIRKRDLWHLQTVTNGATAELATGLNEVLGHETLILGPWTHFPLWLES